MKLLSLEDLKERIEFGHGNNDIEMTFELARKLLAVAEAADALDASTTVSFDLARSPGAQRFFEVPMEKVLALEKALADLAVL